MIAMFLYMLRVFNDAKAREKDDDTDVLASVSASVSASAEGPHRCTRKYICNKAYECLLNGSFIT
jgi:hypothetical protein